MIRSQGKIDGTVILVRNPKGRSKTLSFEFGFRIFSLVPRLALIWFLLVWLNFWYSSDLT